MNNKKESVLASYSSWVNQTFFSSPKPPRAPLLFIQPLIQRVSASILRSKTMGCELDNSAQLSLRLRMISALLLIILESFLACRGTTLLLIAPENDLSCENYDMSDKNASFLPVINSKSVKEYKQKNYP
jgi:hypothetical protein